ncbi:MAG: antirestriction protein ArdA [Oscillospiraceae bacterium]
MILYLTHGNGEESIPLKLPASSSQVDEIDIRLDDICSGEGNFRISDVKSSVKGLWQFIRSADLLDPENLEKLNQLSRQLDAMSEKERQIFAGALLSECINSLDDVLQTAGRIGQYEIITEVTCDRELGGYLVEHGKIDCPEHLKPYLDYVGIGAEFYSNCGGAYTLDGYVVQRTSAALFPSTRALAQ